MRPALFAVTGVALFAYWALGKPTFNAAASQSDWPTVIWFSATLALLAARLGSRARASQLVIANLGGIVDPA